MRATLAFNGLKKIANFGFVVRLFDTDTLEKRLQNLLLLIISGGNMKIVAVAGNIVERKLRGRGVGGAKRIHFD